MLEECVINVKKTWETGNSTPSKNDKNYVEIGQPKVGKGFIEIARPHLQTSEITYQSMIKQFFLCIHHEVQSILQIIKPASPAMMM